jgi:hypothetical protein
MTKTNANVELLYFEDCASWKNALDILNATLENMDLAKDVSIIQVETYEEAVEHQFVGSPTIRLNGEDLFPTGQDQYALGCRVYQTPDGFRGWPTASMLEENLKSILVT